MGLRGLEKKRIICPSEEFTVNIKVALKQLAGNTVTT